MSTTGSAPSGYSVMLSFPLKAAVCSLQHGTAYHWDSGSPRSYFASSKTCKLPRNPLTFEATHDYVLAVDANGSVLAGFYHAATPAWAIDTSDPTRLLACILRNTPGQICNAVGGTDPGTHTAVYGLRVPSGLDGPASAQPLREALAFNFPATAVPATTVPSASPALPPSLSLTATGPGIPAVVTALKASDRAPGEVIVRTYQPTNGVLEVSVTVADLVAQGFQVDGALNVAARTALERPSEVDLSLTNSGTSFTFTATAAITTVALVPPN